MAHPVKLRGGHLGGQREIDLEIIFPDTDIFEPAPSWRGANRSPPAGGRSPRRSFQLDLQ